MSSLAGRLATQRELDEPSDRNPTTRGAVGAGGRSLHLRTRPRGARVGQQPGYQQPRAGDDSSRSRPPAAAGPAQDTVTSRPRTPRRTTGSAATAAATRPASATRSAAGSADDGEPAVPPGAGRELGRPDLRLPGQHGRDPGRDLRVVPGRDAAAALGQRAHLGAAAASRCVGPATSMTIASAPLGERHLRGARPGHRHRPGGRVPAGQGGEVGEDRQRAAARRRPAAAAPRCRRSCRGPGRPSVVSCSPSSATTGASTRARCRAASTSGQLGRVGGGRSDGRDEGRVRGCRRRRRSPGRGSTCRSG